LKLRQAGSTSIDAIAKREAERNRLNGTPLTPAEAIAKRTKIAEVETAQTPTRITNPTNQGRGCWKMLTVKDFQIL